MNDFLPEGTSIPAGQSNYMKLSEPENKFRVLGSAITGFELWVKGKPVRNKSKDQFTPEQLENADMNKFTGKKKVPQYFWAFPVYNYQTKNIEILELTQVTVMRGIDDYLKDEDYGDPKKYDLNVIRDEATDRVEYRVKAKPPKAISKEIEDLYSTMSINLKALYKGEDPFKKELNENVDPDSVKLD